LSSVIAISYIALRVAASSLSARARISWRDSGENSANASFWS
jgi:hypothetical protein